MKREKREPIDGFRKLEFVFPCQFSKIKRSYSVNREPVPVVEYMVPNLSNGKEYEFRVAAVNKAGPGDYGQSKYSIYKLFLFVLSF